MTLSERAEEILEALWIEIMEENRDKCDVSLLKDSEALKELDGAGYVDIKNNLVRLTEKGKEEAANCVRRHRLAERLLTDVLDVKKKQLHDTSCRFEHLLHRGLDDNICTLLGHPKKCPHGKQIPEGACCRDAKSVPKKIIMSLSEFDIGKKARISYLHTHDRGALQKLIAMGALPNTDITLIQKRPSYVFQAGKSQFAIDEQLASHIFVRGV